MLGYIEQLCEEVVSENKFFLQFSIELISKR